ncbi:MAG: type II secretion system protein [Paraclostridium sp.]
MLNKKKNNKGFTLVELLVVIAIIGILAVVAVPALFKNINKAKVADIEADYSAFKSSALSYYTDNNEFPQLITTGGTTTNNFTDYMDSVPTESALGGKYSVSTTVSGLTNKLVLTINGGKATQEQMKKLVSDLGSGKVYNGTTEVPENGVAITNTDINLILIDKTN